MSQNPLVSIVMTSYNTSKFIPECLDTIMSQTYKNWEIVYVDDASDDDSIEVFKKYVIQHGLIDRVIMFRYVANNGYGAGLFNSIEQASGEIIAIVDSDDGLSDRNALDIMVKTHIANPDVSLVYSNYEECRDDLKPYKKIHCTTLKPGQSVMGKFSNGKYYGSDVVISHLKTFKKRFYDMTEKVNPFLKKAVDRDIVLKLEEVGRIIHIPQFLYLHRIHSGSISSQWRNKPKEYRDSVVKMKTAMYRGAWERRQNKKMETQIV